MATNLALASITSTGSTTTRTFGNRFADIINVKDFGAVGDGITDDTAHIQAAFNAVFGTWASPNLSATGQKSIFFPAGTYIVNPPGGASLMTITSAINNGGFIEFGFSAPHGLIVGDNFYVRSVVFTGNGTFNGPHWVTTVNDTTHVTVTTPFNGTYTSGGTGRIPCLRIKGMIGNVIFGSGRDTTQITTNTTNCTVLHINGCRYGHFRDLGIIPNTGGVGLDLNWDNIVNCSTQGNFIEHFEVQNSNADIGIAIGYHGAMCSETTLLSCQLSADVGIYLGNYNATNNSMFGGQCQVCRIGIYGADGGDMCTIHGVSFESNQGGQVADIQILNAAGNGYSLANCRSESTNFAYIGPPIGVHMACCSQMGGAGFFYSGGARVVMDGCYSPFGYVIGNAAAVTLNNCDFAISTYLDHSGANYGYVEQNPKTVTTQTASTYRFLFADIGTKVRFNNSSSQTITIPAWQYIGQQSLGGIVGTLNYAGAKIEVQQIGAGQTIFTGDTGVTIHSSNGLKLRAQYSVATLTVDSNDGAGNIVWTLSGDTST